MDGDFGIDEVFFRNRQPVAVFGRGLFRQQLFQQPRDGLDEEKTGGAQRRIEENVNADGPDGGEKRFA